MLTDSALNPVRYELITKNSTGPFSRAQSNSSPDWLVVSLLSGPVESLPPCRQDRVRDPHLQSAKATAEMSPTHAPVPQRLMYFRDLRR
jgi:hypothetical protein